MNALPPGLPPAATARAPTDLLEIYHARLLRDAAAQQARRLQARLECESDQEALERSVELLAYYDALTAHFNCLLGVLGDRG